MIHNIRRSLQKRLNVALVRASWLEDFYRQNTSVTDRCAKAEAELVELAAAHENLVSDYKSMTVRCAQGQADLATAHRQLLSRYDEITGRCAQAEVDHAELTATYGQLQSDHEAMTARCAQAEAGHAELTAAYGQLQSDHEAMAARCAQAEAGHADLTTAYQTLKNTIDALEGTNQVVAKQVDTLTQAINGTVRNFLYAADIAPAPLLETSQKILSLARNLRPKEAVGRPKIRVGAAGDGGYVMLDDFENTRIAYSLGVGNNVSWDLSLANRNLLIYQFDHTVDAPPVSHPNFRFHRRKIAVTAGENSEDLHSMLRLADDELLTSNAVLKIDIEHDEWNILDQADPALLRGFSQIVCELHWLGRAISSDWLRRAERVIEKINNDFQVIHVHGNNCAPYSLIAGVPLPSVLEVTYCNRCRYEFSDTHELFPSPLDAPNNPAAPDLFLGAFRF